MCGIFGVFHFNDTARPCQMRLSRSADLIVHRGPDATGTYLDAGVGLAHTRLALVDLDRRSDQPMWDQDGRYCLVYNGEIYNYQELRADLAERGVHFHTTGDTEVLLMCLAVDGPERTLPRLEGMFAFAFYDKQDRSLVLARDRFGIKPLLVCRDETRFLFASEAKALMPWLKLRPNGFRIVSDLMGHHNSFGKQTFFEGVEILPAGAMVKVEPGSPPRFARYAELPGMIDRDKSEYFEALPANKVVDCVDEALQTAVRKMLCADARVGALCSGGVDSSLIMAMAARNHSNLAIFHANVVGPLSEYPAALRLAKHLKLDLLSVENHETDYVELTPDVLYHYEQPFFMNQHSVPFLMVSRLVSENGVKAILCGEGSDECFLGYQQIAQEPFLKVWYNQIKRLEKLIRAIPKIGNLLWPSVDQSRLLVSDMLNHFEQSLDKRYFEKCFAERLRKPVDRNVRTIELLCHVLRPLLHRNDTMGMAASIESRFPFLDEELMEIAINLPYRYKIRWSTTDWERAHPFVRDKWVVRRVADRYLPKEMSQRKKWAFKVDAFRRFQMERDYFRGSFVADFFRLSDEELDYLLDKATPGLKIKLMMLEVWGQIFIEELALPVVRETLSRHAVFNKAS